MDEPKLPGWFQTEGENPADPWQPIETARHDGGLVDLWCVGTERDIRLYCGDMFERRAGRVPDCYFQYGAWRPYMGPQRGISLPLYPTHWMPHPGPPRRAVDQS